MQMSFISEEELNRMETGNLHDNNFGPVKVEENRSELASDQEKLMVAVAGEPTNGTIFPKEEKLVWKEMCRVIHKVVENMSTSNYRLLVPVWNKFDLEFLRAAEKFNVPVTFVLPFSTWGNTSLPKFQTDLVIRMKNRKSTKIHIHKGKSFTERVHESILRADLVIGLHETKGLEDFFPTINHSKARAEKFPVDAMQFTTEEQALALQQNMVDNSDLAQQDGMSVLGFKE